MKLAQSISLKSFMYLKLIKPYVLFCFFFYMFILKMEKNNNLAILTNLKGAKFSLI